MLSNNDLHVVEDDSSIYQTRLRFSRAIAKALEVKEFKDLIKREALEQFDKDYDVLLAKILNNEIKPGQTVRDLINSKDPTVLNEILVKDPLTTILVPELITFSARNWNTSDAKLWVAVQKPTNLENDSINILDAENRFSELSLYEIPDLNIVVIKTNERLTLNKSENTPFLNTYNGVNYYFSDEEYVKDNFKNKRIIAEPSIDPNIKKAYEISLACPSCSQRDFVYYGIDLSKGVTEGPYNLQYAEGITDLTMTNTSSFYTIGGWDEGNYEFNVNIIYGIPGSKPFMKKISVKRSDLFVESYSSKEVCTSSFLGFCLKNETITVSEITGLKTYVFPSAVILHNWDMQVYGNRWRAVFEEYDPSEEVTKTYTTTSEFGTNFKATVNFGTTVKVGGDFGVESKTTKSNTVEIKTTLGSDDLGQVEVYWNMPVITSKVTQKLFAHYYVNYYKSNDMNTNSGTAKMSFETVKILN